MDSAPHIAFALDKSLNEHIFPRVFACLEFDAGGSWHSKQLPKINC